MKNAKMSRKKNAVRNIYSGFINKIFGLVFPFIIRTVMINTLGVDYLGLNSLFVSILQVLNLVELGFGSAVVYNMYKPIAENDVNAICSLMNLYKKIYRIIGIIIIVIGFFILPFLSFFIKGNIPIGVNIYFLFVFYLINTAITYFMFSYKRSLLIAHQRNDITDNVLTIINIIQYLLQIYILMWFKNLYLFIFINIMMTIIYNIVIAIITNHKYPQYICNGEINGQLKHKIKKNVVGLMIQRICGTTRNSLDSIFISAFLGLSIVAIYTNYYTIMTAIASILGIVSNAILAGVGNSIVVESKNKNYSDMIKFNFIYMWISGWCTVCLVCLFQPFMEIWMGKDMMLPFGVVILLCIYFYILKMGDISSVYFSARGLFWENRYRAFIESVMNLILNFCLIKIMGLYGILLSTIISLFIINFCYGTHILFKHYFTNVKVSDFFKKQFFYAIITSLICIFTYFICEFIKIDGIIGFLIKGTICCIIPNVLYFVFYFKRPEFKEGISFFVKIGKEK